MQPPSLPKQDVVLIGVGHTNAHVLRTWIMDPPANVRLTCISNFPVVAYSGMLPGVLAGLYSPERMQIDLVRLCAAARARLIVGNVISLDRSARRVHFEDRVAIPYDVVSIGIGSTPARDGVANFPESVVPIKPMQTLLKRLDSRLEVVKQHGTSPLRIAIVGAGAGGVEIALCVMPRVQTILGQRDVELTVIHGVKQLIGGVTTKTAELARRELESRGVRLILGHRVTEVRDDHLVLDNGDSVPADMTLWATNAVAPPLLSQLGLPTDDRGFLLTRPTLQSTADDSVFAVGDSGTLAESPTPKAGVYAVRQGPVLSENIRRALRGETLLDYEPQRSFLKLFNFGDGRALGEYRGWTFSGQWAWKLKDRIDSNFMDMYQDYSPSNMTGDMLAPAAAIRCAGCGGKVGGSVLSQVLRRLEVPASEHVLVGLEAPDDAAVLRWPAGRAVNATVDFFAAPLDDPYIVGRIAALNSASDCFATGARPIAALASASIPVGPPQQQEQLLYELLAGALHEFRSMGATLVGGHTIEGPQLTIGFTMLAEQLDPPRTKGQLRPGDQLILTKPLGTGVLLAALMTADCRAEWYEPLLNAMLLSNQFAASLCDQFDAPGVTDVTGFGLAGHLLEMLRPSQLGAELYLSKMPLLPGAADLFARGLQSTLAPANRGIEAEIDVSESLRQLPAYAALFDPQTSGGLLLGVADKHVQAVLTQLNQHSQIPAAHIGEVVALSGDGPRVRCVS